MHLRTAIKSWVNSVGCDGECATCGPPNVLLTNVVPCNDPNVSGDKVHQVENDTELTNYAGASAQHRLHECLTRFSNCAEVIRLGRADVGVVNHRVLVGLVRHDALGLRLE